MDMDRFEYLIAARGWAHFRGVLDPGLVARLVVDTDALYEKCRKVQFANGVAANMEGSAHHLAGLGTSLDEILDPLPLKANIDRYFGSGKYVISTYSASLNPPGSKAYLAKPHRDIRAFSGAYRLMLNMLVLLDDFTETNGGTLFLSGSHHVPGPPPQDIFDAHAERLLGKAGDIVLFDSLLYHAAGSNRGEARRRGLTIGFTRPWIKGQIDFPRYIDPKIAQTLSAEARQLLGFNARVAASLEEYYQPPERWAFKPDQS